MKNLKIILFLTLAVTSFSAKSFTQKSKNSGEISATMPVNCLDCRYAAWDTGENEGTERVSWVGGSKETVRKLRRKNRCVRIQLHARFDTFNDSQGSFILVVERGKQKKEQSGSGKGAIAAEIDYFFYLSEDDTNDEIKVYATNIVRGTFEKSGGIDINAPANYCDIKISYATPN